MTFGPYTVQGTHHPVGSHHPAGDPEFTYRSYAAALALLLLDTPLRRICLYGRTVLLWSSLAR
ncbi:MAG: hypothetical protein ACQEXJ_15505 [Myxococcota bacterium]